MTTPSERERAEFKKLPKREPHIILPNYFCPTCGAGSDTPIVLDSEEAEAARREERERCAEIRAKLKQLRAKFHANHYLDKTDSDRMDELLAALDKEAE